MASPFQRTSSFDQPDIEHRPRVADRAKPEAAQDEAPVSHMELERWYQTLLDVLDRGLDDDTNYREDLTDLRDEIYAHLH